MFYPAGEAIEDPTLESTRLESMLKDSSGKDVKPVEVFSYTYTATDATSPTTVYATLASTSTDAGNRWNDHLHLLPPGSILRPPWRCRMVPMTGTDPRRLGRRNWYPAFPDRSRTSTFTSASGPSLGEAAQDGSQKVTDLGIGFVQSIGDGMTGADMPNAGMGTYNGNWAATVETAAGAVSLEHGAAELTADFAKATLKADLMGLAMLEGTLDGSMFSGTKATVGANNYGLTSGGKFTGEFSGGFYGEKAVEAGSTFDFSSTSSGAFRGALGGKKMMNP